MFDNVNNFGNTVFRVMLRMRIWPGMEAEFERVWQEVGNSIASHPANLQQWLCRSDEEATYYIVSDWVDESEFREFELSEQHRTFRQTLQPYRASGSMATMEVVVDLPGAAGTRSHRDGGGVRALVHYAARDTATIERTYHQVSRKLTGVSGLRGNELLRSVHDPTGFVVLSRWSELDAFHEWAEGPSHRDRVDPLRRFRDDRLDRPFALYQVAAEY